MTERKPGALEIAKRAWSWGDEALGHRELDRRAMALAIVVRGIFDQGGVSSETFSEVLDVTPGAARELFDSLAAMGVERDEAGRITGAALTRTKTRHALHESIGDGERVFYAWCALDALFIPGLLDRTFEVESRCPTNDAAIRLTVSGDGIERSTPDDVWLSVFIPKSASNQIGPTTPT